MWKKIIVVLVLLLPLTACGTSPSQSDNDKEEAIEEGGGAAMGNIFQVEWTKKDNFIYEITFTLGNEHGEEEKVIFPSSQRFNYVLKNSEGDMVYNYSADKMFALVVEEVTIQPGESLQYEIDLKEALPYIEAGTYTIEGWITAEGHEENIATMPFKYDGKMPTMEEKVTYNGQIDPHSIEVTTEDGEIEVYQLSDDVREKFSDIEEGTLLEVKYTLNEIGQKVIESFEIVK